MRKDKLSLDNHCYFFQSSEPIMKSGEPIDQVAKEEFLNVKRKLEDLESKHQIFAQLINQKVPSIPNEKKFLSQ